MTIKQLLLLRGDTAIKHLRLGVGSIAGICAFFVYPCVSYLAMLQGGVLEEKNYLVALVSFLPLIFALIFYAKFKSSMVSSLACILFVISAFGNLLFETKIRSLIAQKTGFYSDHYTLPKFSESDQPRTTVTPIGDLAYEIRSPNYWSVKIRSDIFNTKIKYVSPSAETASLVISCFNPLKKGADIPTLVRKFESINHGEAIQSGCHQSQSGNNFCLIKNQALSDSLNWILYLANYQAPHGLRVSVKSDYPTEKFKTELSKVLTSIDIKSTNKNMGECRGISKIKDFPPS